ncbi:MAG: site-2 protease family protein [Candidatus Omnitrophica bacterium]|nr:site-2 protease family protein [Candidatus Omnitrophota bacterium]
MKGSFRLLKVFDIDINIHITFLILPFLFLYHGLRGIFFILFVFLCVTLHELTHSVVAKRFGIVVKEITLLPIGGLASMSSFPKKPSHEFLISISGPLFNIVFAAVLYFPLLALIGRENLFSPSLATWPGTIAQGFWINLILAGFNLLPAFPMDGGRVLRSLLARKMDYRKATSIAVNIGHLFALVFGYLGLMHGHFILIFIAFFIYMAASAEEAQVDVRETIKTFKVSDVLSKEFMTLRSDISLSKVLELVFHSHQEDFPVVDGDNLTGFITRADIINNIHQHGTSKLVKDIMRRDFPTVKPDQLLTNVQKTMEEAELKALPVIKDGRVFGVITLEDISRVYSVMSRRR